MDIPRGALYSAATPTNPDLTDGYARRMEEWRERMRGEALRMSRLNPEVAEVPSYIQWLQGNQWDLRRPRHRSMFIDNLMDRARQDSKSILTSGKPTIEVSTKVNGYDKQARIANVTIQYEWMRQSLDVEMATLIDITNLWGTAFWKIVAAKPGTMRAIPCGPDMVMPINPGWNIQDSEGVLYKTYKPIGFFNRKFPYRSAHIEREATDAEIRTTNPFQRPNTIDEYTWNALSPSMRRVMGVRFESEQNIHQKQRYPVVEYQEFTVEDYSVNESNKPVLMRDPYLPLDAHDYWYYVQPGERLYPRKRLVCFGGRRLLYDGPAPFWHGLYPYACLRLDPVPWSFWGKSLYRNLRPLNTAINQIGAGTMDLIERALKPTVMTKEGVVSKPAWDKFFPDMPGQKLRVNASANLMADIRYMDPPPIPAYVFQFLQQFLLPEFDKTSGSIDVTQLQGKRQTPGGDTIEAMRDSAQTKFQMQGRYLEVFLRDAGVLALSNVFQFYTAPQRMRIMGADGITMQDFDFDPTNMIPQSVRIKENFWRNFSLNVLPGSLHSGAGDRKKVMAINLFAQKAISRKELLRTLEVADADRIESEILEETKDIQRAQLEVQAEAQAMMQQQQQGGDLASMIQQAISGGAGGGGEMPSDSPRPPAEQPGGGAPTPRLSRGNRNGEPV